MRDPITPPGRLSTRNQSWIGPPARRCKPRLLELIEEFYPDPDGFISMEQFERAAHGDIATLDDARLDDERAIAFLRRAVTRLADQEPSEWLAARCDRLEHEAARRLRRTSPR